MVPAVKDCRACISMAAILEPSSMVGMQVKPRRFRETARELNRRSGSGPRPSRVRSSVGSRPKSGPARWAETSLFELPKTVTAGAIKPARCVRRAVAITAPRPPPDVPSLSLYKSRSAREGVVHEWPCYGSHVRLPLLPCRSAPMPRESWRGCAARDADGFAGQGPGEHRKRREREEKLFLSFFSRRQRVDAPRPWGSRPGHHLQAPGWAQASGCRPQCRLRTGCLPWA